MSLLKPLKNSVEVGMRVQNHLGLTGTVRWVGELGKKENPPDGRGTYAGVEYDEDTPSPDRHDGKWGEKRYFTCPPGKGGFVRTKLLYAEVNPECIATLRTRYGDRVSNWHDFELVKFCIARNFDMPEVYIMMDNHLDWREKFHPSDDEYFQDSFCEDYPCGYSDALDFDNNVIYCERPGNAGKCTPVEFMERHERSSIVRWHSCAMEMGKKLFLESNYKCKRVCYIVDLSNVTMGMNRSLISFARTVAALDQANYPEHLGRLIIVNCPVFFRVLWKVLRPFINVETHKKVNFVAPGDSVKVLKRFMREEDIPDFAGGPSVAWRSKNCRVGSPDPLKAFKGTTEVPPISLDGIADNIDNIDADDIFEGERRCSESSRFAGSGDTAENSEGGGSQS